MEEDVEDKAAGDDEAVAGTGGAALTRRTRCRHSEELALNRLHTDRQHHGGSNAPTRKGVRGLEPCVDSSCSLISEQRPESIFKTL